MNRVPLALLACLSAAWVGCSASDAPAPAVEETAAAPAEASSTESLLISLSVPNMT